MEFTLTNLFSLIFTLSITIASINQVYEYSDNLRAKATLKSSNLFSKVAESLEREKQLVTINLSSDMEVASLIREVGHGKVKLNGSSVFIGDLSG